MEQCGNCNECGFWGLLEDEVILAQNNGVERGRCHKDAPRATPVIMPTLNRITQQVVPQMLEMTLWPITMANMWCGQFKKAEVEAVV